MNRPRFLILFICCGLRLYASFAVMPVEAAPEAPTLKVELMRRALHHALNLQFDQAIELAEERHAETSKPSPTLQLTRGIIAYFQARWQTTQAPAADELGHQALSALLEQQPRSLEASLEAPWPKLVLGTAAIFDALLQQSEAPLQSLKQVGQGRAWLQEVLIHDETSADAHLGLGLTYFATDAPPSPLLRLLPMSGSQDPEQAVHHLRRAAEHGTFSQDVARTFLARLYEREKRYDDAISLARDLQARFPQNGHYRLLLGRSQCALGRFQSCAETLQVLSAQLAQEPSRLASRDDRFELYYRLGMALNELGRYEAAFTALRQAINQDPSAEKDETLWAKYHVARQYERRGQLKTARQMYQTLLRVRYIEELHRQVERRLAALP